jgi:hypothetical protein
MAILDAGHPGEEVSHLGGVVGGELLAELQVAIAGLLLDENRQVEGVPERHPLEVDAGDGSHGALLRP